MGRFVQDSNQLGPHLGRAPFRINHSLGHHPLLGLKQLAGLAASLPEERVDWNRGQLNIDHNPDDPAKNGLSQLDTVLRIATCRSWIAFRDVGREREYSPMVGEMIQEVGRMLSKRGLQMIQPRCDIYLSSPHAVTPCHVDQHNSFLLQVQGQKSVSVFDRDDRRILPIERLERSASTGDKSMKMSRKYAHLAEVHQLTPGRGLHLPARAPHYVRNGTEVSISLSLTFRTVVTDQERGVLCINRRLRQIGLKPAAPGASSSKDSIKLAAFRSLGGPQRVLRKK